MLYALSEMNFPPEAVPFPRSEAALLHAEQHTAGLHHQHQRQQLPREHLIKHIDLVIDAQSQMAPYHAGAV